MFASKLNNNFFFSLAGYKYIHCCLSIGIFFCINLKYNDINTEYSNFDYITEARAVLFELTYNKLSILTIYRYPRCNFTNFLNRLDLILQKIYNIKYNILICGDVNLNFVIDYNCNNQLDAVLLSFILFVVFIFPIELTPIPTLPLAMLSLIHRTHYMILYITFYKWSLRSWRPVINNKYCSETRIDMSYLH